MEVLLPSWYMFHRVFRALILAFSFEIMDCLYTVLFVLIECIFQIVQTRPYTQVQLSPYPATCIQIKQRIHAKMAMRT